MGRALIMVIIRVLVRAYRTDNIVFSVEGPVPIAVAPDVYGARVMCSIVSGGSLSAGVNPKTWP
jgi:hypothetical protein